MRDGIAGTALPVQFPYKAIIEQVAFNNKVSPVLVAAIKMNETGLGHGPETENDVSFDGGRGIMQLTSSWQDPWEDPFTNIDYAVEHFIVPAWTYWASQGLQGDDLVRAIAATYNAGLGNAIAGHRNGNVDEFTTNNYGARALVNYRNLRDGIMTS